MVHDVKGVRIAPEYWQPRDTIGAVHIEGEDVVQYPNVEFANALPVEGPPYADHIPDEVATFRFVEAYGCTAAVALIALLRDRYASAPIRGRRLPRASRPGVTLAVTSGVPCSTTSDDGARLGGASHDRSPCGRRSLGVAVQWPQAYGAHHDRTRTTSRS